METNTVTEKNAYVINYGRLLTSPVGDDYTNPEMVTIIAVGVDQVKRLALEFIHVIPDDLASYTQDITDWTGTGALVLSHQDDDTFYFSATLAFMPLDSTLDLSGFFAFTEAYSADYLDNF